MPEKKTPDKTQIQMHLKLIDCSHLYSAQNPDQVLSRRLDFLVMDKDFNNVAKVSLYDDHRVRMTIEKSDKGVFDDPLFLVSLGNQLAMHLNVLKLGGYYDKQNKKIKEVK